MFSLCAGVCAWDVPMTSVAAPQGRWTIHVQTAQDTYPSSTKDFLVEEYVLPTFEVEVEAPQTIEVDEKTITTKICAKQRRSQRSGSGGDMGLKWAPLDMKWALTGLKWALSCPTTGPPRPWISSFRP